LKAILTQDLTKYYGRRRGILGLSLEVERGEVFGFLGPNGAGKTTTIRLLLDLLRPTSGRAFVLGWPLPSESLEVRRRVGYLPGELAFYEELSGLAFLRYLAALRGGVDWGHVRLLAERLELDLTRPIRTLSKGNRQKLGLLQAFMHRPELLILDEPTSGLDPLAQRTFQELVREAVREGATVFLSSHVLSEVQALCDRVGIVREGRLVAVEEVRRLQGLRRVRMQFAEPVPEEAFSGLPGLRDVRVEGPWLTATVLGSLDPLIKALARYEVRDLTVEEPDLEELILAYYGGGHA